MKHQKDAYWWYSRFSPSCGGCEGFHHFVQIFISEFFHNPSKPLANTSSSHYTKYQKTIQEETQQRIEKKVLNDRFSEIDTPVELHLIRHSH